MQFRIKIYEYQNYWTQLDKWTSYIDLTMTEDVSFYLLSTVEVLADKILFGDFSWSQNMY